MTKLNIELLNKIKQAVIKTEPSAEVYLYGSRARRSSNKESDWDILILLKQNTIDIATEQKFRHLLYDIELQYGEIISTYVFSKLEWETRFSVTPLFKNIKKEGILL